MAPTTKLKFRGNKAFSMLSTIESEADLSKTWRLMTKVKDSLEYGKRLENLSWRLWFMHHLMVHDQKTQTKFRKLSTATTKKLETEKTTELNKLPPLPSYRPKVPAEPTDKKGKKKSSPKKKIFTPKNNTNANDGSAASSSRPSDSKNLVATISTNDDVMNIDYKTEDNPVSTSGINGDLMLDTSVSMVDGSMSSNDATGDLSPISNATISQHDEDVAAVINVPANDESDIPPADLSDYYNLSELNNLGEEFVLHQFTPDQDPTQVVRLSPMSDFDHPIFIPTYRPPSLGITFSQMVRLGTFYPESPESSEPTSPTEWYSRLAGDTMGQQPSPGIQQNLPYGDQLVTHGAVYVPNRSSPTNSNLNNNLIPSINQSSDLSSTNMIRNNNLVYVNHQYDSSSGNVATAASGAMADSQTGNTASSNASSSVSQSPGNRQPSSTPEGRPKKAHSSGEQQCFNCGVTSTPLWRRSANDELLCNACGLYLKLHKMARPKTMKPHIVRKDARDDETTQPVCSNCGTMNTPLWRRDEEGQTLCNACGLYFKLHHEKRPLSMKTDVIKKRQRYENGQNPNRRTSKKQRSTDTDNPQDQQQQYGQISVSPTTTSMTIPTSIAVQSSSTPAMNVPTSLNSLNIVEQDLNSSISMPPPTSPMTTPAPNRSLHGVFRE